MFKKINKIKFGVLGVANEIYNRIIELKKELPEVYHFYHKYELYAWDEIKHSELTTKFEEDIKDLVAQHGINLADLEYNWEDTQRNTKMDN